MSSNGKNKSNENIQVYVRCRPINLRERNIHSNEMIRVTSEREVVVHQMHDNKMSKKFTFDRAFGPDSKQDDVYKAVVAPLINEVLAGYNCTVFAYGQTGTGKTYTMIGDDSSYENTADMGIIPRAVRHMFDELRLMKVEFTMRISYLELYNEELSDLLSSNDAAQIRIYEDTKKKGSIIVQGLEEIPVRSTVEVFKQLERGAEKRKMASTLMNAQSSRSHTIFSVHVHITEKSMDGEELVKIGKLNLVDLAGSENITKAGNEKGIRTRETVSINQSLLTLGRVITALVERTPHVPYRESKLTRLLQESLGGRTKTSIIATISPGHKDLEETLSTLEYAHRAKNIQNRPELNQKIDKKIILKEYTEEIDKLKRDLMASRDKNGIYLAEDTYNQLQYEIETKNKELSEQIQMLRTQKDDLDKQQNLLHEVSTTLAERTKELQEKKTVLDTTKHMLEQTKRGYVEKKQIMLKHMHTEQLLTNQARELIGVADAVSNDANKLHASIARRRDYDNINREACDLLDASMSGHLNGITEHLETFSSDFERHAKNYIDHMDSTTQQSKEMCLTATTNLRLLLEFEQQGKTDIDACLSNHKAKFSDLFEKQAADNRQSAQTAIETKAKFAHQTDQLESELRMNFNSFETEQSRISDVISGEAAAVTSFCENLSTKVAANTKSSVETMQNCRQTIDDATTKNEMLMTSIIVMLGKMKDMVVESVANNNRIKEVSPTLCALETAVEQQTVESTNEITSYGSQMHQLINDVTTKLNECDGTMKAIDTNATEMIGVNRTKDAEMLGHVNAMHANFGEQKNQMSTRLDEMLNEIDNINEMTEINIDAGLNRLINECGDEHERIDNSLHQFNEMHANLESIHKDYLTKLTDDIKVCAQRLQTFQKDEVKIYQASGQTPSKREYSYPKKLATTSPHAKIIKDYWQQHDGSPILDCSAIVSESKQFDGETANDTSTNSDSSITLINNNTCDIIDLTLCNSRNINAYSTPIIRNNITKMPVSTRAFDSITAIAEDNKEN